MNERSFGQPEFFAWTANAIVHFVSPIHAKEENGWRTDKQARAFFAPFGAGDAR
jgi:hypothetical protein